MVSYREVRDFYERMPYPAPLSTLDEHQDVYLHLVRRATEFRLLWPTNQQRSNLDNVVAGILCTLDSWEDKLYSAIDGSRSVSEIIGVNKTGDKRRAQEFFERLWQYDQIVFDASRSA